MVENIIPWNMIINLGCASVDNHIPLDDIIDYHQCRECNIYIFIYIIIRRNKNEFIKELFPDYYKSHMYWYFHMTILFVLLALTIYCKCVCAE